MTAVYHYTHSDRVAAIWASQLLKLSDWGVAEGLRPTLWLSTNPHWEPSVKRRDDQGQERPEESPWSPELVRYEVDPQTAAYTWNDYIRLIDAPPRVFESIAELARRCGADLNEWRMSFRPIPDLRWLTVQARTDGEWGCAEPTLWAKGEGLRVDCVEAAAGEAANVSLGMDRDVSGFIRRLARIRHALTTMETAVTFPGATQVDRAVSLMRDLHKLGADDGWLLIEGETQFGHQLWLESGDWAVVPLPPADDAPTDIAIWPREAWRGPNGVPVTNTMTGEQMIRHLEDRRGREVGEGRSE